MLTRVIRNNEIGVQIRGKTLLSEIQNQLHIQSVTITLAGEVIIYKQAEKGNWDIYPCLPLLPATYKILYKIRLLTFIGHAKESTKECHCGFQRRRSATYQVLCVLQTLEMLIYVTPYFDREMNPRMGGSEFDSRTNQEILFFFIVSRHFLRCRQHLAYWVPGFFPGV
jgi:hypothetical protein